VTVPYSFAHNAFAATLQAAQTGSAPILLRVGAAAGHGHGKPTGRAIAEAADCLAFIDAALPPSSRAAGEPDVGTGTPRQTSPPTATATC